MKIETFNVISRVPVGGIQIGVSKPLQFASLTFESYMPVGGIVITQAP
jgi:hypothetical protein